MLVPHPLPIKYYFHLFGNFILTECDDPNPFICDKSKIRTGIFSPFEIARSQMIREKCRIKLKIDLDAANITNNEGHFENIESDEITRVLEAAGWISRFIPIGP